MHTKEPWAITGYTVFGQDENEVSIEAGSTFITSAHKDDARRIVACVNACRPFTTESLEMHGLAGITSSTERILREQCDTAMDEHIAAGKHIEELEQQRDELLAALESAVEAIRLFRNERQLAQLISLRATAGYVAMDAAMDRGNAAIAKVTQS